MQRRTIASIFLVSLALLAGYLSAPLQTTTDGGADGVNATSATTVSTTGTGEVTADADLTVISIAVTTTVDSADETRGTVADDMAAVRATLTNTSIAEGAAQTTGPNIYPEYDYSSQERELLGYRATHTLRVEITPDHTGEAIDLTVGTDASEIHGVTFTLTDEKRAKLREGAPIHAVDSTKVDADSITSATDLTVTGVHTATVSSSTSSGPYPVAYTEDAARASSGSTELSPGPVTVSATVQVVYEAGSG